MRVNPENKILNKDKIKRDIQAKTDKITRLIALFVAFLSVFFFIIKIMFL